MANVEVAFATPERQVIVSVPLEPGMSARDAVKQADLASYFENTTETDFASAPLGIFGEKLRDPDNYRLMPGERLEVYRPLEIDPKQARRERAAKASTR